MSESLLGVWPPLPPRVHAAKPLPDLPFPLGRDDTVLYSRARSGVWHGVRALGLGPGDAVLVPAYHHGSEIEALRRCGLELRFYDVGPGLAPTQDELEALLDENVRALHLIHYLGVPQDVGHWRGWCDERGLLLLEDAAQSWLAERDGIPVGSLGDLAIFSLYKTFGLPDGAACRSTAALPQATSAPWGQGGLVRTHLNWLGGRSALAGAALSRRGTRPYSAERDFELGDVHEAPSGAARYLLPRIADPAARSRRLAHYDALFSDVGDRVPELFPRAGPGSSPFVFPVEAEDKEALLRQLAAKGVRGLDLWAVPHPALPADEHPGAARLRREVVGLPVHQELRPEDVERLGAALRGRPRQRRSAIERVTFESIASEWDALALATGNVFATREWLETWWGCFGDGKDPAIRAVRGSDGTLVAVLPLYEWRSSPVRVLRLIGHSAGDELGPVCLAADRVAAAAALRDVLAEAGADVFLGEQMRGDLGWDALLGARVLRSEGSPVLPFEGRDGEALVASWSKNLREQVRRRRRKLEREHGVAFRLADASTLQEDLGSLFALHRLRWSDEPTSFSAREAFHRAFAPLALERGWLRLWLLEIEGTAVAAWYGFRFGGADSYYQMGRDPGWDRQSVGFVLLTHTILDAVACGSSEYRFLRGDEPYKYRFASTDPGLVTVGATRSAKGAAALGAVRAARGARALRRSRNRSEGGAVDET